MIKTKTDKSILDRLKDSPIYDFLTKNMKSANGKFWLLQKQTFTEKNPDNFPTSEMEVTIIKLFGIIPIYRSINLFSK